MGAVSCRCGSWVYINRIFFCLGLVLINTIFSLSVRAREEGELSREAKVKAAYVYNFLKYVEWSESIKGKGLLTICVSARDEFKTFLEQLVQNRTAAGKKLRVESLTQAALQRCDVAYIQKNIDESLILPSILIISNMGSPYVRESGIVLFSEDHKVKFMVDLNNVQSAGLKLSSELLKLAKLK